MKIYKIQAFEFGWGDYKDEKGCIPQFNTKREAVELCKTLEHAYEYRIRFRIVSWDLVNRKIVYNGKGSPAE